ncbi:hypothetical protein ACFLQL_00345 [Verrucomicrobiota bacterium]
MDVLHDNNWSNWLHINESLTKVPDYVKKYTPLTKESASELSDSEFADSARRLFPVNDPENTWLSAAYFGFNKDNLLYKKAELDYIAERIKTCAAIYGNQAEVDPLLEKAFNKSASVSDDDYGLVTKDNQRSFPMFDVEGVKKACDYFKENRMKYQIEDRRIIAENIIKKADQFGVSEDSLPSCVFTEAGHGIPDKVMLMDEILERSKMAHDDESASMLANINNMVAEMPIEDLGGSLGKIAEVIEAFDVAEGLRFKRHTKLLSPSDVVFNMPLNKISSALTDAVKLNKHIFSLTKLASLSTGMYADLLGEQFVSHIVNEQGKIETKKLAEQINKLNIDNKDALEVYLKESFSC